MDFTNNYLDNLANDMTQEHTRLLNILKTSDDEKLKSNITVQASLVNTIIMNIYKIKSKKKALEKLDD